MTRLGRCPCQAHKMYKLSEYLKVSFCRSTFKLPLLWLLQRKLTKHFQHFLWAGIISFANAPQKMLLECTISSNVQLFHSKKNPNVRAVKNDKDQHLLIVVAIDYHILRVNKESKVQLKCSCVFIVSFGTSNT